MLAGIKFEKKPDKKKKKKEKKKKKKKESSSSSDSSDSQETCKASDEVVRRSCPLLPSKVVEKKSDEDAPDPLNVFVDSHSVTAPGKKQLEFADPEKCQVSALELNPQFTGGTLKETQSGSRIPDVKMTISDDTPEWQRSHQESFMEQLNAGRNKWLQRSKQRQQEFDRGQLDISVPLPLKNDTDRLKEEKMSQKQLERMSSVYKRNEDLLKQYKVKGGSSSSTCIEPEKKMSLMQLIAADNDEADEAEFPAEKLQSVGSRDPPEKRGWREKQRGRERKDDDWRAENRRRDDDKRPVERSDRNVESQKDEKLLGVDVLQQLREKHLKKSEKPEIPADNAKRTADNIDNLDANELGALAMEAMLEGDMEKYNRINAQLNQLPVNSGNSRNSEQKALEEIDASGRSKEMMNKVRASSMRDRGKLAGQTMTRDNEGVKNYFANDECTFEELVLRERIEGVADYDSNYRKHILSKGSEFRERDEDEDVEYSLGNFEQKQAKTRKRGQDPAELERREKQKEIHDAKRVRHNMGKCSKCMEGRNFDRRDIVSESPEAYLRFERANVALAKWQLVIVPKTHFQSVTELEENCAEEIRNYQKTIKQVFKKHNLAPVFIETVTHVEDKWKLFAGGGKHAEIEVIPIPLDKATDAIIYAKKSLLEAEEWTSKGVIDCPTGPRGKIPPSFAYLHIDVALERGFAHVIEDPRLFPSGFGRSILYDILEADRFTKAYTSSEERDAEKSSFLEAYAPEDWAAHATKQDYVNPKFAVSSV